jgi:hypothetical protein
VLFGITIETKPHASKLGQEVKKLSLKALLATEQRIPGLGNGVLQDILFKARMRLWNAHQEGKPYGWQHLLL